MDMGSTDERVDQWQVNSDTHGHNVVVVFKATKALAQNINTAAIELENTIDIESLPGITPFSFAEIGFACGWPLKPLYKIIEEYFASYYFKIFSQSNDGKNHASRIILPDISPFNSWETGVIACPAGHWILSKGTRQS